MNFKSFSILLLATSAACLAESAATSKSGSEQLREDYVEGLRLISDLREASENAGTLLSVVEQGAAMQALRIGTMDDTAGGLARTGSSLEKRQAEGLVRGKALLDEKKHLDERFAALERAVSNSDELLKGATKTVSELLSVSEKSGRQAERKLAEQATEALKTEAGKLHYYSNQLGQVRLHVSLEHTLLQGLQEKAAADVRELAKVKEETNQLVMRISEQHAAVNALQADLLACRSQLNAQNNEFSRSVEKFRLVQVSVLRRWLLDGPPEGELPGLTISDLIESGVSERPLRPTPDQSMMGPLGGGFSPSDAAKLSSRAGLMQGDESLDGRELSPEAVQLHKRANWYLAILRRLNSFLSESLGEASAWANRSESWRNALADNSRQLSEQRGTITSLNMEQSIVSTTLKLISNQAATVQEQVCRVCKELKAKTAKLDTLSLGLEQHSRDAK